MKDVILAMDVFLSQESDAGYVMYKADKCCSRMTIDGREAPLLLPYGEKLLTESAPYYKGPGYYHVEYTLVRKTNIPENAFCRLTFKSITIPEGIKTI